MINNHDDFTIDLKQNVRNKCSWKMNNNYGNCKQFLKNMKVMPENLNGFFENT